MCAIFILVALACIAMGYAALCKYDEEKRFNKCKCIHCGGKLRRFAFSAYDNHTWYCDNCGYTIHCEWGADEEFVNPYIM